MTLLFTRVVDQIDSYRFALGQVEQKICPCRARITCTPKQMNPKAPHHYGYNLGELLGRALGVGVGLGTAVEVGVGVAVAVGIGVAVGVDVDVGVGVGVGVGLGPAGTMAYA